ncbi:Uncharacterised protein [Cedecea neteri]|uniref:Uncharacterized protein n=1 Tax=Cedecea neteri TaxID=158822 RepID=A0A2X2T341_9ENTR|nr:Uncharacterised protein [Cedecea neteri]
MQISSGPGGFSPLLPENHFPGLDGASPDSQNGSNSITAKLLLNNGGNTLAIPLALNFANTGAADKPSAINFGNSPASNNSPAANPANASSSDGSGSADSMMQELQQMLQQFLKELMQLFHMNTGKVKATMIPLHRRAVLVPVPAQVPAWVAAAAMGPEMRAGR